MRIPCLLGLLSCPAMHAQDPQDAVPLVQESRAVDEPLHARPLRRARQVSPLEAVEHGGCRLAGIPGERDDRAEQGLRETLPTGRAQDACGPEPLARLAPVEGSVLQPSLESLREPAAESLDQVAVPGAPQLPTQLGPGQGRCAC